MKGLLQRAVGKHKKDIQVVDPIKVEIYSEIDRMVEKLHAETTAVSTNFAVIKNDTIIPLIVIIGSIIVLFGGALFFLSFYNSKEKTILTTRNVVLSTESKILAAVKAESEEQLEIRDQQIKNIRNQLSTAIEDRNRLKENTEKTLNAREEELRKAMAETLEAERAELAGQGLSKVDIQKKIAETSSRLESENQSAMNDFKEQYEQELAEKELAMSIKIEEYKKNLEQSQSEQTRLKEQIAQREKELMQNLDNRIAALEDERKLTLSQLEEMEDESNREKASLSADIDNLKRKLSDAAIKLRSKEEQIQQAEKEQEVLNKILMKVGDIKKDTSDQEQILDLLETKILLKQVLSSEPVKSQHPELLDQIELYFDVFGDTRKEEGRTAALTEINNLLESLTHTE